METFQAAVSMRELLLMAQRPQQACWVCARQSPLAPRSQPIAATSPST